MSANDDGTLIDRAQAGIRRCVDEWLVRQRAEVGAWLEEELKAMRAALRAAPLAREIAAAAATPPDFVQVGEFAVTAREYDEAPGAVLPLVVTQLGVARPPEVGYGHCVSTFSVALGSTATVHEIMRVLSGGRGLCAGRRYRFALTAWELPPEEVEP